MCVCACAGAAETGCGAKNFCGVRGDRGCPQKIHPCVPILIRVMAKVVAVTGANGFIASHVCQQLLDAGYVVRAVVRNPADEVATARASRCPRN